jgi:transcription-repair coupling factor (superfamily II helicase)
MSPNLNVSLLADVGKELRELLSSGPARRVLTGLKSSSLPFLLSRLDQELEDRKPWVLLSAQAAEAEALASDLKGLGVEGVEFFPESEILPYDRHSEDRNLVSARVETLEALAEGRVRVLCISVRSWMRKLMDPERLLQISFELEKGRQVELEDLRDQLTALGYRETGLVEEAGDFAIKGGIVDLFSPTQELPVRLELDGDEVASLRLFDPSSQLSTGRIDSIRVLPCSPVILDSQARDRAVRELQRHFPSDSILTGELISAFLDGIHFEGIDRYSGWLLDERNIESYLPDSFRMILIDEQAIRERWEQMSGEAERRHRLALEKDDFPPPLPWSWRDSEDLAAILSRKEILLVEDELSETMGSPRAPMLRFSVKSQPSFGSSVKELRKDLEERVDKGYRIWIYCDNEGQADRLREILPSIRDQVHFPVADLQYGFFLPSEKLALFTDHEIFDRYKRVRRSRRVYRGKGPIRDRSLLKPGDYVVHIHHGVARYRGIVKKDILGEEQELFHLSYAGDQELFVPVERLHLVERYMGRDDGKPGLNRLGEKAWVRTRRKAEKAVREMATELIRLYARREASRGFSFPEDTPWQKELEASFLYQDTPDQGRASEEVKKDMEKPRPMDRLVCGDVGFGKTEVAIRAAFKAVQAGKQVAILVPTTILAQQHFQTFSERLREYPVRIDMVSRFRKAAEIRESLEKLAEGKTDLIIGTHRLLSQDVKFKDIGLLVVDEEHRFGVKHKERLKNARASVDVITLTATPIPRTLNMSLGGIRDVSLIQTPPRDRLPVHTEVVAFDEEVIREAILREIDRGGQVFFVHNRVQTIEAMAAFIRELIPGIRVGIGHGQMDEKKLEQVMVDFIEGEFEVLVSSMIIESGLDIPRVNTILINRSDRFGVAQLHQLRGRVGRSRQRAFAYLMIPQDRRITDESRRRLEALVEFDELGSGYQLALRDLEIRGAGDMLGAKQHGHIAAVGFDLYLRLVNQAVREIQEGKNYVADVKVESDLSAFIPNDYIEDAGQKMSIYQRMGHLDRLDSLQDMKKEILDRFGPEPEELRNLFTILEIKILAQASGVRRVRMGKNCLVELREDATLDRELIRSLAARFGRKLLFRKQEPWILELRSAENDLSSDLRELLEELRGKLSPLLSPSSSD